MIKGPGLSAKSPTTFGANEGKGNKVNSTRVKLNTHEDDTCYTRVDPLTSLLFPFIILIKKIKNSME